MNTPSEPRRVSTREASILLGCVERTVVLWLQQGALHGTRDGRRWMVDVASIERHPSYRRTHAPPALLESRPPQGSSPSATQSAPSPVAVASPAPDPRRPSGAPPDPPHALGALDEELAPRRPRKDWTFRSVNVLRELTTLAGRVCGALQALTDVAPAVLDAARLNAVDAASYGAAGYHAWVNTDKLRLYARARESAAMTAASLWVIADAARGKAEGLRAIAHEFEQLSPALGGLMRHSGRRHA